jgi:hypothetical protein
MADVIFQKTILLRRPGFVVSLVLRDTCRLVAVANDGQAGF